MFEDADAERPPGHAGNGPTFSIGATAQESAQHPLPQHIGNYRIIRLLGWGGMGAVYEAEQEQPRRNVALKVIRDALATPELLRRFAQESQSLARLHHPGIAQIYEAGSAETGFGVQPFFAMELIHGLPLVEYADSKKLDVRRRLGLMIQVCDAVHHAHQRGIIHRDLKPGNILVDENGQPKILDFGLARATDSDTEATRQTDMGQMLGTLAYMSPEQVLADPGAIDTRSDVYALGIILYELLAGKMPYTLSRQLHEAVRTIQQVDPTPLSTVSRALRGDLETIASKALEKDKERRYASAAGLAGDLRRYLEDQPITAKPASASYQLQKFARRHKAIVAGVAAVFLVLVAGVAASTWEAVKARKAERNAQQQSEIAQAVNDFLQKDLLAQASAFNQTKPDPDLKVRTALDRAASRVDGRFPAQPLVEAGVRNTIATAYVDLGLYADAERQLERAIALRRQYLGENNPDTLVSMASLAAVYERSGKLKEAETLYVKYLASQQGIPAGSENPNTLKAMNGLAVTYTEEGRYSEAETIFARLVPLDERIFGENDFQTLRAMGNLASTYDVEGKHTESKALFLTTLERERRVLGEENPETLGTMENLALIYLAEGDYTKAESLMATALAGYRRVLGEDHRNTIEAMDNLSELYRTSGKNAQSETLAAEALNAARRSLGNDHPFTLDSMFTLALTYASEGRDVEAEPLLTKVLEGRRRVLGNEHPDTLDALMNLGELRLRLHHYGDAERILREASTSFQKVMPDSWQYYLCQNLLGASLAGQKKSGEAEQLLVSGYEGMVQRQASIEAPELPRLTKAGARVVQFYKDTGSREKAAAWRDRMANHVSPSVASRQR